MNLYIVTMIWDGCCAEGEPISIHLDREEANLACFKAVHERYETAEDLSEDSLGTSHGLARWGYEVGIDKMEVAVNGLPLAPLGGVVPDDEPTREDIEALLLNTERMLWHMDLALALRLIWTHAKGHLDDLIEEAQAAQGEGPMRVDGETLLAVALGSLEDNTWDTFKAGNFIEANGGLKVALDDPEKVELPDYVTT